MYRAVVYSIVIIICIIIVVVITSVSFFYFYVVMLYFMTCIMFQLYVFWAPGRMGILTKLN